MNTDITHLGCAVTFSSPSVISFSTSLSEPFLHLECGNGAPLAERQAANIEFFLCLLRLHNLGVLRSAVGVEKRQEIKLQKMILERLGNSGNRAQPHTVCFVDLREILEQCHQIIVLNGMFDSGVDHDTTIFRQVYELANMLETL